ncbi:MULTISPECIES: hypothetical protein [unclassified Rhodococcus (in: high G+C Gram-positive bacteria)]|uniref:hypothetical protein n=1 Tax=unclassified Rhodococcus (in: high G+C Gram-positive bacteria) TaxID=192944 RepID=UPI001BB43F62|nr:MULTISPECIES: hypothetical protein [unclassified Rhodococcus (in: high G+C Gram-positive bacteria)]
MTAAKTRPDTGCNDSTPDDPALLEGREAGIAVPIGLALLTTLVWAAVLCSSPLALLMLVAVAGIAGLTAAAL